MPRVVLLDLALIALAGALALARLALRRKYRALQAQGIKATDLGHAAAATVAALACFHSPAGMLASALITALYVVYQAWEDKSARDIATYLGTFVAVVAAKIGLPLAHIT
ncbi:MAG: hypothetical protein LM577_07035 [Thermoproteaceae archaeon]|nr:hypothetical protein [Thermoproteaceae archaeon]